MPNFLQLPYDQHKFSLEFPIIPKYFNLVHIHIHIYIHMLIVYSTADASINNFPNK